jgi:hypothetical protein
VPVPGLPGEPLTGTPPASPHRGQGCARLAVKNTADESATFVVWAPVERSSVPLAGALQVVCMQVLRAGMAAFGISSGAPKLHPVVLQSGSAELGGGVVVNAPMVQVGPVQLRVNRLVAPSGVGPSGRFEPPPPTLRPPQVRFLMRPPVPFSVLPQMPPGVPVVKSRNAPPTETVVVVEVDVEVVVVELVVLVVELVVLVVVVPAPPPGEAAPRKKGLASGPR